MPASREALIALESALAGTPAEFHDPEITVDIDDEPTGVALHTWVGALASVTVPASDLDAAGLTEADLPHIRVLPNI